MPLKFGSEFEFALVLPLRSPQTLTDGESDLVQTGELMRFTISANMAGIPALSIPVGQSPSGARPCQGNLT